MVTTELRSSSGIDAERFRRAFGQHPAGVAVITAESGIGPVGMTATSVVSVNADPPVLAFSVSDASSSAPTILAASSIVVHLLDADDVDIAVLCATSGVDRFADESLWSRLPTGEPYFPGARRWLRVAPSDRLIAGGAHVLTAVVLDAGERATLPGDDGVESAPLVYHSRTWHRLGSASSFTP